jgi:PIN domain nuclease of toxin-antitoxin system
VRAICAIVRLPFMGETIDLVLDRLYEPLLGTPDVQRSIDEAYKRYGMYHRDPNERLIAAEFLGLIRIDEVGAALPSHGSSTCRTII